MILLTVSGSSGILIVIGYVISSARAYCVLNVHSDSRFVFKRNVNQSFGNQDMRRAVCVSHWKGMIIKCIRPNISFLLDQLNEVTVRLSNFNVVTIENGITMEDEKKISQYVDLQATKQIFNSMLHNNMAAEHDH